MRLLDRLTSKFQREAAERARVQKAKQEIEARGQRVVDMRGIKRWRFPAETGRMTPYAVKEKLRRRRVNRAARTARRLNRT